jgi:carboxypeptidase Taq
MNTAYTLFIEKVKEIYSLQSAAALLGWDQETMMPPRGGQGRADSLATLSKIIQEKICEDQMGDALDAVENQTDLSTNQKIIIREIKKDRKKLLKVPVSLTQELSKTTSLAQQIWTIAKPKNDKTSFDPWLKKVFTLSKQLADCFRAGFRQTKIKKKGRNRAMTYPRLRTTYNVVKKTSTRRA